MQYIYTWNIVLWWRMD